MYAFEVQERQPAIATESPYWVVRDIVNQQTCGRAFDTREEAQSHARMLTAIWGQV